MEDYLDKSKAVIEFRTEKMIDCLQRKLMDELDEKIYFPKSFNEQMPWIDESIEHIIKHGKIKKDNQERGRASYGKQGYTHAIHRLFEIIKADPKNKAVLREVYRAEQELMSYTL